jgi:hypothetical protein
MGALCRLDRLFFTNAPGGAKGASDATQFEYTLISAVIFNSCCHHRIRHY